MSYKALLFCPDEKTARTVTQVLSELDFQVETCLEPFATVKRLTAEHFDALVVDCENEQNATLLFKSARNSGLNQASLSIAVVEGQTGVAKAFRIGANLVLTKPINVEQSKGTIRVARGLLRKSEAAKPAAPSAKTDHATQRPASISRASISPVPAPGLSSTFETEHEPEPQLEPTEAALLESMPDPAADMGRAASTQTPAANPWQPISKPAVAGLRTPTGAMAQADLPAEVSAKPAFAISATSAAAAAPARQKSIVEEEAGAHAAGLPSFAPSAEKPEPVRSSDAGGTKKTVLIAAAVLVAAGIGYIGMSKINSGKTAGSAQSAAKPQVVQPVAPAAAAEQAAAPEAPAETNALTVNPSVPHETAAAKSKRAAIASSDADDHPVEKQSDGMTPPTIVVRRATQEPAPAAAQAAADDTAPTLDMASGSTNDAISGLVNVSPSVPHQAMQTVKVSQGISQGLLVKKVPPVYPQQAMQMRIQGAVQIAATISKTGNVSNLKLVNGDPILGRAAMDAVKQWKYKPYYLDSEPVEIQTQVTVNFKLP